MNAKLNSLIIIHLHPTTVRSFSALHANVDFARLLAVNSVLCSAMNNNLFNLEILYIHGEKLVRLWPSSRQCYGSSFYLNKWPGLNYILDMTSWFIESFAKNISHLSGENVCNLLLSHSGVQNTKSRSGHHALQRDR